VPTSQSRSKAGLIQNPARVGHALANVLSLEGGREVVLGQAWIAAPGRLITCGHVVERFINAPGLLYVRFPASGNKYQVARVSLHPSFVRQPDQLVKFDVALLEANLQPPESDAMPLPFSYEQDITTNQTLWAIRYPAHLGQLSAAPQPLTQDGRYLGQLRIHDKFHLLHDLPLAPGDSGAPISDGANIVALHCGDTATLPGLNLPTTSIRLALWVDALRELGISETATSSAHSKHSMVPALVAFVLSVVVAGLSAYFYLAGEARKGWAFHNPKLMPVQVSFNKGVDDYKEGDAISITITPAADYYVHLFAVEDARDAKDSVFLLYPQYLQQSTVHKGEQRVVNTLGKTYLTATSSESTCYLVAVRCESKTGEELDKKVLQAGDIGHDPKEGDPLLIKGKTLAERLRTLQAQNPDDLLLATFPGVHSKQDEK
jgi:hypothetical protein